MNNRKKKLKYKIISHFMTQGNKMTCENIFSKSFKLIQKSKKKISF